MEKTLEIFNSEKFWKKASGEVLGFVCIMPILLVTIYTFVSIVQFAFIQQKLTYCAYTACRSAAVSETFDIAKSRALNTYNQQMGSENADKYGYERCSLEINENEWRKGAFVTCTVKYHIKTILPIQKTFECSLIMMIENGGV